MQEHLPSAANTNAKAWHHPNTLHWTLEGVWKPLQPLHLCLGASSLCILPPHHETATSEFGKCKSTCPVLQIQMLRHGTSQTPSIGPYQGFGSHCNLCICVWEPPHYASYHPIKRRLPLNLVSARALAQCCKYKCKGMEPAKHLPLDLIRGLEATATFAFVFGSLLTMHLTTPSRDGYL